MSRNRCIPHIRVREPLALEVHQDRSPGAWEMSAVLKQEAVRNVEPMC
jgi:hypothetical protein